MLVQHLLEQTAERAPDRVALVSGESRLTYAEYDAQANRLAHALRAGGVVRGDRVVILLENSIEVAVAIFGALKADATFMVLHPGMKQERLSVIFADAAPAALVTDHARMKEASGPASTSPGLRCVIWAGERPPETQAPLRTITWASLREFSPERPASKAIELDLATLIYTSGTTGQPKGVMCAHGNMLAVTNSVNAYLRNTEDDAILLLLPLSFGYGLYQLLLAAQVGARVVIEKGFAFPARTVALINEEGVTALPGVPTFFALLLKYPALLEQDFPTVRYLTSAASALPVSHLHAVCKAFPKARFYSMYGLTECQRASYLPPEEIERRPASVGVPIPGSEVYLVDEEGNTVPPGEAGELVVRGPHVMRGYWRAPELTERRFRPGALPGERVLYTGDLFKTDDEGFLYFVARKDDIIKTRGEKVSPREIENAVCSLDGVLEAAVVGVPDAVLGQAIKLVVVAHEEAQLAVHDIRAYCQRTLDDFMLPKYVEMVASLPRNDNGKVDKKRLLAVD